MQALDTMGRDGPTDSDAHIDARTLRSAVQASSPLALGVAAVAFVAAICSAFSTLVPLAAAIPVALLIAPALVDVLDHRLPNRMVAGAALAGVLVATATVLTGGDIDLRGAALGAAVFVGPLLVMHLIAPASMGFGDVKSACVLGAAVGMIHPFYGLLALAAGSLLGAAVGLVGRRRTIAFGPALVGGAVIALVIAASPAASNVAPSSVDVLDATTEHPSEDLRS